MRRHIKHHAGALMFGSGFGELLLRQHAVVVAFHRVHPAPDTTGLTIGVAAFERYCRFFAAHFRVVELAELVCRLERGLPVGRHLAITFDDGYRDNYEYAAPILRSFALPATFFVVSRWIGSDVVPWWDSRQGVRHPWMSWTEVCRLRDLGFTIGAHTRTHVDLGRIAVDDAEDEIRGARAELERRLSTPVDLFAYPFGGRTNMADANREIVKRHGFRCCCSCYGGLTGRGTDPYRLRRVPITPWHSTPGHFGFDLILRRT
jgi:peptidoglycan/xylan/chitin deacetylase (PgdA/CDA1 family)